MKEGKGKQRQKRNGKDLEGDTQESHREGGPDNTDYVEKQKLV